MATLTYHALRGSAPPYLASSFTCVADMPHRRRLRSASTEQLDVPTCRRSTIGGRAFPAAGAKVWNGLPSDVPRRPRRYPVFNKRRKTYLFRGPCNSFHCLGHFKNVYDDDHDDRLLRFVCLRASARWHSPTCRRLLVFKSTVLV